MAFPDIDLASRRAQRALDALPDRVGFGLGSLANAGPQSFATGLTSQLAPTQFGTALFGLGPNLRSASGIFGASGSPGAYATGIFAPEESGLQALSRLTGDRFGLGKSNAFEGLPDRRFSHAAAGAPSRLQGGRNPQVTRWGGLISEASLETGVPSEVIAAIMDIESDGDPGAMGKPTQWGRAYGLMQVMPFHFSPGEDPMDPRTNIRRGAQILAQNYQRYGSWDQAAAAYFGAIDDSGNVTGASDATGTSGWVYVQLFREALSGYHAEHAPAAPGTSVSFGDWVPTFDFGSIYTGSYRTGTPHRGIDLQVKGATYGGYGLPYTPFIAPGKRMQVIAAGPMEGASGNGVILYDPEENVYHAYFHNNSVLVRTGQWVDGSTPLATVGESGSEGEPHLHYEVRRNVNGDPLDQLIDPRPYMQRGGGGILR